MFNQALRTFGIVFAISLALSLPASAAPVRACEFVFSGDVIDRAALRLEREIKIETRSRAVPSGVAFARTEIKDASTGVLLADLDMSYRPHDRKLLVGKIEVYKVHERGLGLGEALMAEALRMFPETEQIQTVMLTRTNRETMQAALDRGMPLEIAVKETPAYKIPKKLGFTELIPESIHPITFDFTVRKP